MDAQAHMIVQWAHIKTLKIGTFPAFQKLMAYMKNMLIYIENHQKSSLALQTEALINTGRQVDFLSPGDFLLDTHSIVMVI